LGDGEKRSCYIATKKIKEREREIEEENRVSEENIRKNDVWYD